MNVYVVTYSFLFCGFNFVLYKTILALTIYSFVYPRGPFPVFGWQLEEFIIIIIKMLQHYAEHKHQCKWSAIDALVIMFTHHGVNFFCSCMMTLFIISFYYTKEKLHTIRASSRTPSTLTLPMNLFNRVNNYE